MPYKRSLHSFCKPLSVFLNCKFISIKCLQSSDYRKYLHMLLYYLRFYSQLMSPLKSSKLMWPQSPELKSSSLTRARCPMKGATSQIMRVIPSVQYLDAAFLTTCKPRQTYVYSVGENNILLPSFSGVSKAKLYIWPQLFKGRIAFFVLPILICWIALSTLWTTGAWRRRKGACLRKLETVFTSDWISFR